MHPGGDREGMWTLLPGENLDGRIEKFVLPEISYNQITSKFYPLHKVSIANFKSSNIWGTAKTPTCTNAKRS